MPLFSFVIPFTSLRAQRERMSLVWVSTLDERKLWLRGTGSCHNWHYRLDRSGLRSLLGFDHQAPSYRRPVFCIPLCLPPTEYGDQLALRSLSIHDLRLWLCDAFWYSFSITSHLFLRLSDTEETVPLQTRRSRLRLEPQVPLDLRLGCEYFDRTPAEATHRLLICNRSMTTKDIQQGGDRQIVGVRWWKKWVGLWIKISLPGRCSLIFSKSWANFRTSKVSGAPEIILVTTMSLLLKSFINYKHTFQMLHLVWLEVFVVMVVCIHREHCVRFTRECTIHHLLQYLADNSLSRS